MQKLDQISDRHAVFFFSRRRRHTRSDRDWSSDVCSSDLGPLIKLEHLRRSFEIRKRSFFGGGPELRATAVDDVGFTIERGECLGLVGESGCGKTTLSKMLLGALTPDSGKVTYYDAGKPVDVLALKEPD